LPAAGVEIGELNWLAEAPEPGAEVELQIRHGAEPAPARVERVGERLTARFHEPQRAVTPGQSGVVFRGDRLLGGGRIRRGVRNPEALTAARGAA
ncbi:MAG: tRNA 2-thiouridine(34) synthase MnmA, partial [Gemmatimonadetes bacterium]|nr:tRNA 2-thiouridine(34) synthase MnmA [Gemmatimonadota bacterium]NIR80493.1 tRNA 2-thiouridine(34) synthase MnmA [Gemmatimonadota bacterium]NIT89254.1 tRNA 2-thiouridine(34) synthase MnmA [Gemmatimonadota bacterium]NIU33053.1 tRNA 2-thiouridine(34) synthase MnmA [Gemmatimonadota bacterium]NIU37434.1 tRNA 2-thiouridine(34) synthase MnmA [Gemmatimonadota bacterium]